MDPDSVPLVLPSGPVEIACVVDRSGSMEAVRTDAIGGFNAFLRGQQALPGEAHLTLVLFDHEYALAHDRAPLGAVPPLDERAYAPRGRTALLDAIGHTVGELTERIGRAPVVERPSKVVVAILTDGLENASREWTRARVADLIRARQADGWEFVFLAANQDVIAAASEVGIGADDAFAFEATGAGTARAFDVVHEEVTRRRTRPRRGDA